MFVNPLDPDNKIIKGKILEWLKQIIPKIEISKIEISEQPHCLDRACPDATTLIKIYNMNVTVIDLKIPKPLVYVRKWDIEEMVKRLQNEGNL